MLFVCPLSFLVFSCVVPRTTDYGPRTTEYELCGLRKKNAGAFVAFCGRCDVFFKPKEQLSAVSCQDCPFFSQWKGPTYALSAVVFWWPFFLSRLWTLVCLFAQLVNFFFFAVCVSVILPRPGLEFNCCGNATHEPLQKSARVQIGFSIELVSPAAELFWRLFNFCKENIFQLLMAPQTDHHHISWGALRKSRRSSKS